MIPDNEDKDDNKIYFFYTEKAMEGDKGAQAIYTRVGRICAVSTFCIHILKFYISTMY